MSNMPHCRFQNTLPDLLDCLEHIEDTVSPVENLRRKLLVSTCSEILLSLGIKYDHAALVDALNRLPETP